ncbi:hypothetical protein [Streptomyces sp. MP131-18]|uniref:hypothetical protein n=1 Tax=Streptomyces sp. MP131-18 TaxID=1857892 RepID=UPI0009D28F14|nr:hypothetical protein [Streptomyces sp. MP131-18]ONK12608.1 hypothetical protein STBA_33560 [Streptomyces sp. MP131-18]
MNLSFKELVDTLGTPSKLIVRSTPQLAADVEQYARERVGPKRKSSYMYRKRLEAVDTRLLTGMESSPAEVLRELGLATTFVAASPFADIARHWAHVRYCATLRQTPKQTLALSKTGADIVHHHKVAQSEQIGIGLALVVAKQILERKYPGWIFSSVDVDTTLAAGFLDGVGPVRQKNKTTMRPDYFLIGRHASGNTANCKVFVLECKGTHGSAYHSRQQMATASLQVGSVEVASRTLPSLIVASRLSVSGVEIDVLDPPGEEDLWSGEPEQFDELVVENPESPQWTSGQPTFEQFTKRKSDLLGISQDEILASQDERTKFEEIQQDLPVVFNIPGSGKPWLFRTLARNAAHATLRFAGDNKAAAKFATPRVAAQRSLPLDEPIAEWHDSMIGSEIRIGSRDFVGVKYSMPILNGKSFEIFRGVEKELYERLRQGKVSAYLSHAHRLREEWQGRPEVYGRRRANNDAVSVGNDGTVIKLRIKD